MKKTSKTRPTISRRIGKPIAGLDTSGLSPADLVWTDEDHKPADDKTK